MDEEQNSEDYSVNHSEEEEETFEEFTRVSPAVPIEDTSHFQSTFYHSMMRHFEHFREQSLLEYA